MDDLNNFAQLHVIKIKFHFAYFYDASMSSLAPIKAPGKLKVLANYSKVISFIQKQRGNIHESYYVLLFGLSLP